MTTIEEFLIEVNIHELYYLAESLGVVIKTGTGQKTKAQITRELASELDAKIVTNPNNIKILREFIKKGRIQAFAFKTKPVPNVLNEIFISELEKFYDTTECENYIMYEPKELFKIPKAVWYCKLKNTNDESHFIAFQKFLKKDTLSIHTINNELMSRFGLQIDKPLLTTSIIEIFRKIKNKNLEYTKINDFKIFYASHVAKDRFITSSTHLSSGNEKVTKNLKIKEEDQRDDLDINLFIKNGMAIDDKSLLDYMVVNTTNAIIDKLQEIKINLIKIIEKDKYIRYKILITNQPNIIHLYNIDTTIDDIILLIKDINAIK